MNGHIEYKNDGYGENVKETTTLPSGKNVHGSMNKENCRKMCTKLWLTSISRQVCPLYIWLAIRQASILSTVQSINMFTF